MDEIDHEVDEALKIADKVLKNEEDCKVATLDDFKSDYDGALLSLYSIAEKRPQLLQNAIK